MSQEQRVRAALRREAEKHEVDVAGLYTATRGRLAAEDVRARRRPRSPHRVVLAAAAAVVAVAAMGVATPLVADRLLADGSEPGGGPVDDYFSCPAQRTVDAARSDDDGFLPELSASGEPVGEAAGAPRDQVVVDEDRATLRLGNPDGSLASISTFEKVPGGYRLLDTTVCSNDPVAGSSSLPLVDTGLGDSSSDLRAEDVAADAVLVLDRLTYDVSGLSKRITAYAYPCGLRVCVESGTRGGTITRSSLPRSATPVDLTSQLSDPDDVVGVESAQRLVALYDRDGSVAEVAWTDAVGTRTVVLQVDGASWPGQLFLVLAPTEALAGLDVRDADGAVTTYDPAELRD